MSRIAVHNKPVGVGGDHVRKDEAAESFDALSMKMSEAVTPF